ncbi:uncharacterized protein LOC142232138 [Haematobia irritans]|uniref:uncharacterized protein LOC142232138 n=1 Tax=Haematobia irritans TaxID=7368 RepID=UPI003F4FFCCE
MEQETNEINSNNTQQQTSQIEGVHETRTPPATRASSNVTHEGTTLAGLPRRRLKWTYEMNVSVLKAYYKATRNNSSMSYRQQMYDFFLTDYPNLGHLTQQNLADRRAAIMRKNLIPLPIQEEIRLRILNEITPNNSQPTHTQDQNDTIQVTQGSRSPTNQNRAEVQPNTETQRPTNAVSETNTTQQTNVTPDIIRLIFNEAKLKFTDMNPKYRPNIPKQKPNRKMRQITAILNNEILPFEINADMDYNQLISIMYCSAYTITEDARRNRQTSNSDSRKTKPKRKGRTNPPPPATKPKWELRLSNKIEELRKDLGYITSYINERVGKRSRYKLNKLKRKYPVHTQHDPPNDTIEQTRDTIRQKLKMYATRLRNYTKSYNRSKQNKIFQTNEKKFYNSLTVQNATNTNDNSNNTIPIHEIEDFWKAIWGQKIHHNTEATWLSSFQHEITHAPMTGNIITNEILKKAIQKIHNWKQPGSDKIHNYYYKHLTTVHPHITKIFNDILSNPNNIHPEMCSGITYLIPKNETLRLHHNFDP